MGVCDVSFDFDSRGRHYRIGFSESMMIDHVELAEVRVKTMKKNGKVLERFLRQKTWLHEDFCALVPGGPVGMPFTAIVARVKDAMDAGWNPLT